MESARSIFRLLGCSRQPRRRASLLTVAPKPAPGCRGPTGAFAVRHRGTSSVLSRLVNQSLVRRQCGDGKCSPKSGVGGEKFAPALEEVELEQDTMLTPVPTSPYRSSPSPGCSPTIRASTESPATTASFKFLRSSTD